MAAKFVDDTFTDTAETALGSHVGETGATWAVHPAGSTGAVPRVNAAGRLRGNDAGHGLTYFASGTPSTAEYDVEADFVYLTNNGNQNCLVGRLDTTALTGYFLELFDGASQWRIFSLVNGGSFTVLGTYSQTFVAGTTYHAKLQIRDAAKKAIIDGVERISSADNSITAAGRAGLNMQDGATDTTGAHLDNFAATNATTTDTTPPVVGSASVNSAGTTLTINFTEAGSPPVLPASSVVGFTLTASGGAATLSATAISGTTFTATISRAIQSSETITLGYAPGNVTDSAATPNAMASFSGTVVTNNSTQTPPLAAGVASFVSSGPGGISVSAVAPTGGAGTLSYQWERNASGGAYSDITGATSLTPTDTTGVAGTLYGYRCKQTRGGTTVTTNTITAQVYPGGSLAVSAGARIIGG